MPVYYELINGTIYVVNRRNPLVKTPAAVGIGHCSAHDKQEVCDAMNAAYRAGYQTALNQFRAYVDQAETQHATCKKDTH